MEKISVIIKLLLYYCREAIHIWFGLRLLLTKNLADGSTYDKKYDLGYWINLKFKVITFFQWFFNNHRLFAEAESRNLCEFLEFFYYGGWRKAMDFYQSRTLAANWSIS